MAQPRLIVYNTDRNKTSKITVAFARGVIKSHTHQVKHIPIADYLCNGWDDTLVPGRDAVATLGILRGTGLMLKEAQQRGLDYYYIDHAYFNPGYSGKGWMRVTKNGHACNSLRHSNSAAWDAFAASNPANHLLPWRTNEQRGEKIIICPPTHAVSWYTGVNYDWGEEIAARIRHQLPADQHDRTVIRRKPKEPIVDSQGNLLELRTVPQCGSLDDDLDNAYCVVAYNSMVALAATLRGIPVIVGDISCCTSVGFKIDDFKKPDVFNIEPDRLTMLHWLANNQWKIRDFENGAAWERLQENYR